MKRVIVHIDRLVLHGLRDGSPESIAQGLREQLTATLSAPGAVDAWNGSCHSPRLQVGPVVMPADASPAQVGQALGGAIGKGVVR